ncbi:MAG: hypothetical protein OJF51_003237 [Nitrospira sp.]|jgi:hypothetical protein|nr:MAG: hypothetical protein OJF51_003237 [Nitrospira sp.]
MAMRTVTVVRQYLAATFLIGIGLFASGCGDTATVNQGAQLASLTVAPGSLEPTFSSGTTQYNVNLSSSTTSVTITAQPAVSGDTVTINGQNTRSSVITLGAAGTTTPVSIVVSGSGANPGGYTVRFIRAGLTGNNSLQNLAVSPGTPPIAFSENTLNYTVDVANNVGSVAVTPTLQDPAATMTVNGQAAISGQASIVPLKAAGQDTAIPIVVTAQNNSTKTYTVTVSRGVSGNFNLRSLTVSPGTLTPAFNAGTLGYTVNLPSNASSITVTPTLQDTTASMAISVNSGQPTNINSGQSRTITLGQPDSNTFINIIVTAQNGNRNTYAIVVDKAPSSNNNLSALSVTPGTLSPRFAADTLSYTVNVATGVETVTVSATKADPNAVMAIGSVTVPAGTRTGQAAVTLDGPGSDTPVSITVRAPSGAPQEYRITIHRAAPSSNNNLSALSVTPGTLSPRFAADTLSYTVNVATGVETVTVSATKADPNAAMAIGSVTVPAGTRTGQAAVTLDGPDSDTPVSITVTAPSGAPQEYRITIHRAAPSSNNNLSALSVTPGTLSPRFAADTLSYTVNVATSVETVTVSATKADPNAVMAIGSVTVPAGTRTGQAAVTLGGQDSDTPVSIIVTAPSGAPQEYRVTIHRAAPASNNNLSALSVTPGSLSPAFAADTLSYTVNVASDVTSVAISATKADSNAVISGDVPNSGQANITLSGATTPVSIIVTAPSGASKTYSIDLIRATPTAPPAPVSAPDLIPQDDSGFLPGQDSDNITNVNTPRFRISQPGSGETPNLYVDGNKVDSTFNQGANTLKPTSALSDGDHTITSTVTNAGGESSQSPPLPVTIDTIAPGFP